MNANEIGKRLGIGVRVAGRLANQHAQQHAQQRAEAAANQAGTNPSASAGSPTGAPRILPSATDIRAAQQKTHKYTRAAGRGVGGFLRPFGRVGGILWLEVTGFFFGLFALFFAQDLWRARASYASGPLHQRFWVAVVLTAVFAYLCMSAFWRAKRK